MPTIIHYRERCIGCHICQEMWPLRWRMSTADGKGTLVGGVQKRNMFITPISDQELTINLRVANACPVKVIKLQ